MILIPFAVGAALAASTSVDRFSIDNTYGSLVADSAPTVLLTSLAQPAAPLALHDEEPEPDPIGVFTGQVTIGGAYTEGNTERRTASVAIDAKKIHENDDVLTLGFNWNFTQQDDANGTSIARNIQGRAKYDVALDERSYVWVNGNAQTDTPLDNTLATLDLRWSAGVGYGYKVLDNEEWQWGLEAGLAFFHEDFEGISPTDYLAARVASLTNWNYSDNTTFSNYLELYPSLEESDDIYGRSSTRATTNLTERMIGQLEWIWDWDNTPAPGRDRSDHIVLLTIGWGF